MRGCSTVTGLSQWRAHPSHRAAAIGASCCSRRRSAGAAARPARGGGPRSAAAARLRCSGWRTSRVWLCGARVWAPLAYAGPARDLVRALKFRGALGASPTPWRRRSRRTRLRAARRSHARARPAHPARLRSRGFNQAAVIAEALARRAGLRSPTASCGRGRPRRSAATVPSAALARPVRFASRALRRGGWWSWTTWSPRAPRSPRARRFSLESGTSEIAAVAFARTLGR